MKLETIPEAQAELSALIEAVSRGEEVIIGRAGRPVAKLVPYPPRSQPRTPGALRGAIEIKPGFDDLPDDLAAAFGATAS